MKRFLGPLGLLTVACAGSAQAAPKPLTPAPASRGNVVEEVVVTAQTLQTQTLVDRKVYTITKDLQATSGTAADVLNNVPSVSVDADGNISLRGDGNVTVLVDGKPSAQFTGPARGLSLQQFSAADIERVEVLTIPPAQYKAEGSGGVINIITRKTRRAGFSGTGQLSLGDARRYVAALSGAYNVGGLKLSGGLGLRQDMRERVTTSDRVVLDALSGAMVASQQTLDEQQHRLIPSVKANLDFDLTSRQSVAASFSHRELMGTRRFDQNDVAGPVGASVTGLSSRHDDGHDWSADTSEGVRFDQKLWRPNETLSLGLQHSGDHERERNAYRNAFRLPPSGATFDALRLSHDLVKTEFNADYDLPLSGDRELKLGYDLEDDHNAFDTVASGIDSLTGQALGEANMANHFRYRQRVNAAYGEYQARFGPWQAQAGVRLESASASFLQVVGNLPGARSDSGIYPSLHLVRTLGEDAKVSLGVSRRLTRPDPEILNPFVDSQDTHNLRAGNPNLAPQDTWSYEAGYNVAGRALTYGATAYYRIDRNAVTDVIRPISPTVVLSTKANLPTIRSAGVELTANGKLGSHFSYNLSGNLFAAQIEASSLGGAGLRSTMGLNLKGSIDWRPTAADTAQVSLSRTDRRLTPQGSIAAIDIVNVGYRRQLRPDLSAVFTVTDLFDAQRVVRTIDTPQLHDRYVRHQFGRIAYVGLVYTFGGQKPGKPSGFEYDP